MARASSNTIKIRESSMLQLRVRIRNHDQDSTTWVYGLYIHAARWYLSLDRENHDAVRASCRGSPAVTQPLGCLMRLTSRVRIRVRIRVRLTFPCPRASRGPPATPKKNTGLSRLRSHGRLGACREISTTFLSLRCLEGLVIFPPHPPAPGTSSTASHQAHRRYYMRRQPGECPLNFVMSGGREG